MGEIKQFQRQSQSQIQKMSQKQIQAVSFLSMSSKDLREEILKMVDENLALEIVKDPFLGESSYSKASNSSLSSDDFNRLLESKEDSRETLQQHLIQQLSFQKLSDDETDLCQKLIYNLDKDGFYGSMLKPESLIDSSKSGQNIFALRKCIKLIQQLDPIGTCCKDAYESLLIQAEISGKASDLTLFILDGHLDLINASSTEKILENIKLYQKKWHSKAFASALPIDGIKITEEMVEESFIFIKNLNPFPAGDYISDTSGYNQSLPDVVLTVEKVDGQILEDDFSTGKIKIDRNSYFQIKYASGVIPEIKIVNEGLCDKTSLLKARDFIDNIRFMKNSFVLQGCGLVKKQMEFFLKGPGNMLPFTRRDLAYEVGVHESTVSRFSAKKYGKYIQTPWGLFPASYFFSSGINADNGGKISSESIKKQIEQILLENNDISDSKLAELFNQKGIKIARRTVAKYRNQLGINNSFLRK